MTVLFTFNNCLSRQMCLLSRFRQKGNTKKKIFHCSDLVKFIDFENGGRQFWVSSFKIFRVLMFLGFSKPPKERMPVAAAALASF